MQKILLLLLATAFFSCQNTLNKTQPPATTDSTVQNNSTLPKTTILNENDPDQRRKEFEEEERSDSLLQIRMLRQALDYAVQNKQQPSFSHAFTIALNDRSNARKTQMMFGNLFDRHKKHLLIRREAMGGTICGIYLLQNQKFKNVCEHAQLGMTYMDDSTRDIDGDHYKDFVVHWYPAAGCCPRNAYNVYLYKPQTGTFTESYEFINPTFAPEEKLIRGFTYGHPEYISLYKYQWHDLTIDTIEYISHYPNKPGKFIKTVFSLPAEKAEIILQSLPEEYKRLENIDWFSDF